MKSLLFMRCIAVCTLLFPANKATAQITTSMFNPKAPVPEHPSQMYLAQVVEYSVGIFRKHHDAQARTGLPDGFHYYIRQWQQQDVNQLAGCPDSYDVFETLLGIANHAVETTANGQFTPEAIEAQNALTYLKPDCCKSWKGFYNLIAVAANATQSVRDGYRRSVGQY